MRFASLAIAVLISNLSTAQDWQPTTAALLQKEKPGYGGLSGATWAKPIAVPKELKGVSPLTWLDYDPANDALYVMKMTSELYRWERGSKP